MKKLLLLLLLLSLGVVFNGCEKDDPASTEQNNNNDDDDNNDDNDNNPNLTYNCIDNDCFAEEGGQYATLDDCLSVCGQNTYCENCFIIFVNDYDHDHDHDHDEISVPIGEFCGDDLADIEAEGFDLMEDYEYVHKGDNYFLPAGHYPASELNCE